MEIAPFIMFIDFHIDAEIPMHLKYTHVWQNLDITHLGYPLLTIKIELLLFNNQTIYEPLVCCVETNSHRFNANKFLHRNIIHNETTILLLLCGYCNVINKIQSIMLLFIKHVRKFCVKNRGMAKIAKNMEP